MCGLSGQFVDSTVLILKSEVCRTAFSQNRSWLKSFLQGAYLFGAKIGSFGGIFAMKKTIALFAAVLMLLCAVPFAAIGEMNLAAAKTAGDFPMPFSIRSVMLHPLNTAITRISPAKAARSSYPTVKTE